LVAQLCGLERRTSRGGRDVIDRRDSMMTWRTRFAALSLRRSARSGFLGPTQSVSRVMDDPVLVEPTKGRRPVLPPMISSRIRAVG
jgi:hypothetical protein